MMERFYFDVGAVSVFAGREANSNWGIETSPETLEIWAGNTYVCASFVKGKIKTIVRTLIIAAGAFTLGWMVDPPLQINLAMLGVG